MKNRIERRRTRLGVVWAIALLFAAALVGAGAALAQGPEPAFMKQFFAPDLVMKNHRAIGLREDQREAITRAIRETQSKTLELQWAMQDAVSALEAQLAEDPIDERRAAKAAEKVMEIEGRVKRAHLALLIRIRNRLDPDQRQRLRAIREGDGPAR